MHRSSINRYLVSPGQKKLADIIGSTDTATHGERHEALLRGTRYHFKYCIAIFRACGDIKEAKLVRASRVVDPCLLHRITRVAQIDEIYSLDNASVFNIKAGYDACLQHFLTSPSVQSAPRLNRVARHKERGR